LCLNYGIEFIILSNLFELLQISGGLDLCGLIQINHWKRMKGDCACGLELVGQNTLGQATTGWQPAVEAGDVPWRLDSGVPAALTIPGGDGSRGEALGQGDGATTSLRGKEYRELTEIRSTMVTAA
jgi:hypothetical protein